MLKRLISRISLYMNRWQACWGLSLSYHSGKGVLNALRGTKCLLFCQNSHFCRLNRSLVLGILHLSNTITSARLWASWTMVKCTNIYLGFGWRVVMKITQLGLLESATGQRNDDCSRHHKRYWDKITCQLQRTTQLNVVLIYQKFTHESINRCQVWTSCTVTWSLQVSLSIFPKALIQPFSLGVQL